MRQLNINHSGQTLYTEVKRYYDDDGPGWPNWHHLKPHQQRPWHGMAAQMNNVSSLARAAVAHRSEQENLLRLASSLKDLRHVFSQPEVVTALNTIMEALDAVSDDRL